MSVYSIVLIQQHGNSSSFLSNGRPALLANQIRSDLEQGDAGLQGEDCGKEPGRGRVSRCVSCATVK